MSSPRRIAHTWRYGIRACIALLLACAWGLACPQATLAAPASPSHQATTTTDTADDPFASITAKINALTKQASRIATPVAALTIVFVLVMHLFAGLMPELIQQYKGFITRALIIVALIGFIPDIVTAISGLSAGS